MKLCLIARYLLLLALPTLLNCSGGGGDSGDGSSSTDRIAPTVSLTAPANFASGLAGTVALSANATDNVAVTLVEFEVDGQPVGSDASAPYVASVDASSYASGQHMVRARARDAAANVSDWSTATPYVFVHYTTSAGGTHNRISRFTALGDVALASSEQVLVELPPLSSATNHNGGALHFGNDGKLYVGVGENADPARAQDLTSPFGKLLRFNEDGSIPADNPFFSTQSGLARAIWAYGLRNPFTFAVQSSSGRIHINDVGQNTWEEINVAAAGANFDWPNFEGPANVSGNSVAPLFAYKHSAAVPPGSGPGGFFTGFSIAGGTFYPSTGMFPAFYQGNYFFADFVSKFIGRLDSANDYAAYAFASISDAPVDMLVGLDGALLVLGRASVTRISRP